MPAMMKCGHVGNATIHGKPACIICYPGPGSVEVDESPQALMDRKAKCGICGNVRDSSINLPFFEHRADMEYDLYYCGCMGWD